MRSLARALALALLGPLGFSAHAPARDDSQIACPIDLPRARQLSDHVTASIRTAATLDEAKQRALDGPQKARAALSQASLLALGDTGLTRAEARLDTYEHDVQLAQSQEEVATRYASLTGDHLTQRTTLGLGGEAADVHVGSVGCSYTTGEVIAIVLGLILGIIPGIILLILLC